MRNYLLLSFCCLFVPGLLVQAQAQNITTIAGTGVYGYSGDGGPATAALLEYAWYNAVDQSGNVYFTDNANHRVRKISTTGTITTIAGNGIPGFTGDGGAATAAELSGPSGVAVDVAGNVYIADVTTRRVRKINTGGIITTIAGTGIAGSAGDGGPATAAQLNTPYAVMADAAGNIYIADVGSNKIRKIDATGNITTVAGNGTAGFSGDGGPATAAKLSSPGSIALDATGKLYIADITNNRIRVVNTSGNISTMAGNGTAGYLGDGGAATAAELNQPLCVAADAAGNIYISDQWNNRIRRVDPSGTIVTIAGTGLAAYGGDGGPATAADIRQPYGIALDTTGDLYLCDKGNFRVRRINYHNHVPFFTAGVADSVIFCEDDSMAINTLLAVTDADTAQVLTWTLLSGPAHGTCTSTYSAPSTAGTVVPSGFAYTPFIGYSGRDTIKVRVDDGLSVDTILIYAIVKPLPSMAPITGPSFVCMGTADTLHDTATGGVWSASNGSIAVSSTGVITGVYYGTDTISYTHTLAGCTTSASKILSSYPVKDSISGPSAVCIGLYVNWTGIPAGGVWTASNGIALVIGGLVGGISPGIDTITYTVTNPCGTTSFQKVITVNDLIAPTVVISGTPGAFITAGQTDTLKANIYGGGGISYQYQWQLNGWDIAGATDSTYISSTLANGDSVTCIVTNGPCSAASFAWIYIVWVREGVAYTGMAGDKVYLVPNPGNTRFSIEGMTRIADATVTLELTDMVGNVVYREVRPVTNGIMDKEVELDSRVASGTYLLHIITSEGRKVVRLQVEK